MSQRENASQDTFVQSHESLRLKKAIAGAQKTWTGVKMRPWKEAGRRTLLQKHNTDADTKPATAVAQSLCFFLFSWLWAGFDDLALAAMMCKTLFKMQNHSRKDTKGQLTLPSHLLIFGGAVSECSVFCILQALL